jgi:hypothetical protein
VAAALLPLLLLLLLLLPKKGKRLEKEGVEETAVWGWAVIGWKEAR